MYDLPSAPLLDEVAVEAVLLDRVGRAAAGAGFGAGVGAGVELGAGLEVEALCEDPLVPLFSEELIRFVACERST